MSGFVCLDANVAAKWVIPETEEELAKSLYLGARRQDVTLVAPPHFQIEVATTIRKRVAQGHDDHATALRRWNEFEDFEIQIVEPPGLYRNTLEIAERYSRPTAYDAHYIALAEFLNCEFWTADYRLINALNGRLPFVRPLREFRT
jgi:predicted nucleic acid-binding protein